MTRTLEHWTADSGHRADYVLPTESPGMLAMLAPMIAARAGFVPGCDGWTWTARTVGTDALDWTLQSPGGVEVLRCAASLGGDRAAWGAVADAAFLSGGVDPASDPPEGPWLLAAVRPGAAGHVEALDWLSSFCRALAWAWIERRSVDPFGRAGER
ncbi:MAG: hypothetical protein F4139_00795 [Gemmatimonadetes bacterium]|nr:hypothetical protein [Gemmatimonadota bacterium]MYA64195.1 hypothetical protein [Gemmatimonadota bacterium]MYB98277.1 hypothetical protein [Gemmatimonadota bacterium]MYH51465.1 hypothetical protein [Gemmatimonadota bacterium]MYI47225.1 hypothetical protein [Gemmatimonadota bacterium]